LKEYKYELIGIPSGDYETSTFDVPFDEFVKYKGIEPTKFDKSCFYDGLYRLYDIPFPSGLKKNKYEKLIKIKIKLNVEINETNIDVIEKCED